MATLVSSPRIFSSFRSFPAKCFSSGKIPSPTSVHTRSFFYEGHLEIGTIDVPKNVRRYIEVSLINCICQISLFCRRCFKRSLPLTSFEELVDLLRDLLADALHLLGLVAALDLLVVLGDCRGRLPVGVGLELLLLVLLVGGELVEEVGDPHVHALLERVRSSVKFCGL